MRGAAFGGGQVTVNLDGENGLFDDVLKEEEKIIVAKERRAAY